MYSFTRPSMDRYELVRPGYELVPLHSCSALQCMSASVRAGRGAGKHGSCSCMRWPAEHASDADTEPEMDALLPVS
eukprot:SAG22_NODE_160_length_16938_cov_3.491241_9_plen_76_part_00